MTARIRRSERDRICCTLARLSPIASAISGPLELAAEAQRDDLPLASAQGRERALEVRAQAQIWRIAAGGERVMPAVELVERLLARRCGPRGSGRRAGCAR